MKTYKILHNEYPIGQHKGKFKAVKALERHLEFNGWPKYRQVWNTKPNRIEVIITGEHDRFSIEEDI